MPGTTAFVARHTVLPGREMLGVVVPDVEVPGAELGETKEKGRGKAGGEEKVSRESVENVVERVNKDGRAGGSGVIKMGGVDVLDLTETEREEDGLEENGFGTSEDMTGHVGSKT
jgi:hypothetical protein